MKRVKKRVLLALAVGGYGAFVPTVAQACDTITMCIDWNNVLMEDAMFGDVAVSSVLSARNARVNIIRPYPEPAIGVFLDDGGCVEFDSQFRAGHKAKVFAEVVLDWDTDDYIQLKSFASQDDQAADEDSFIAVDIVAVPENFEVSGLASAQSEMVSHLVVAAEGVATLQDRPGTLLTGGQQLAVTLRDTQQNASAGAEGIRLGTIAFNADPEANRSSLRKKYIVMHEVGHWIQFQLGNPFPPFDYDYGPCFPDPDDGGFPMGCESEEAPFDPNPTVDGNPYSEACTFAIEGPVNAVFGNPNSHGIRSAEFAGGAAAEGFAHFVAAAALNTSMGSEADGTFRYYKNVDELALPEWQEFEDGNRVVSVRGGTTSTTLGGPNGWVENECALDWAFPFSDDNPDPAATIEISTELDWLRFFWRFVTASSAGARPTFWETVDYASFVQGITGTDELTGRKVWAAYEAGVLDSSSPAFGFSGRFYTLSDEQGLYNDGP